jgi:hypothetical protein
MEESDVMLWLVANCDKVTAIGRALGRDHQVGMANFLLSLARSVVDDADWHQLISRYVVMH